tara:strand:- start:96 stop:3209 length:3114 start_codon:yes stop_codon:yes gene_type:complete
MKKIIFIGLFILSFNFNVNGNELRGSNNHSSSDLNSFSFSSKFIDSNQPSYEKENIELYHQMWTEFYIKDVLEVDMHTQKGLDFLIRDGFIPLKENFTYGDYYLFRGSKQNSIEFPDYVFDSNMVWQDVRKLKQLLDEYDEVQRKIERLTEAEKEYKKVALSKHPECRFGGFNDFQGGKRRSKVWCRDNQIKSLPGIIDWLEKDLQKKDLFGFLTTEGEKKQKRDRKLRIKQQIQDEKDKIQVINDLYDELKSKDKAINRQDQLLTEIKKEKIKSYRLREEGKYCIDLNRNKAKPSNVRQMLAPEEENDGRDVYNSDGSKITRYDLIEDGFSFFRGGSKAKVIFEKKKYSNGREYVKRYYESIGYKKGSNFMNNQGDSNESDFIFWFCRDHVNWTSYILEYLRYEQPLYINTPREKISLALTEKESKAATRNAGANNINKGIDSEERSEQELNELLNLKWEYDWIIRTQDGSEKHKDRIARTLDYFDDDQYFNILRVMYDEILSPSNLNNGTYVFSDHIRDFSSYDQIINRRQSNGYYELINWLYRDQETYYRHSNKLKAICSETFNEEIITFGERVKKIFPGIDPCKPQDVFKAAFHFFSLSNLYGESIPSYEDTIFVLNLLPNITPPNTRISSKTSTLIKRSTNNYSYGEEPKYEYSISPTTIKALAISNLGRRTDGIWNNTEIDSDERDSAPVHIMELNIWTFIDIVRVARGGEIPHITPGFLDRRLDTLSNVYLYSPKIQSESDVDSRIKNWHLQEALIDGFLKISNGKIGVYLDYDRMGRIEVKELVSGGAAINSGIKVGDKIIAVATSEDDKFEVLSYSRQDSKQLNNIDRLVKKLRGDIGATLKIRILNEEGQKVISLERKRTDPENKVIGSLIKYYEDLISIPNAGQNGMIGNRVDIMLDPQKYKDIDYENYKSLANSYYLIKQCYEERSGYAVGYITRDEFNRAASFFRNQSNQMNLSTSRRNQIDANAISNAKRIIFPASAWGKERSDYCSLQYSTFMNTDFWSNIIESGRQSRNDGTINTIDTIVY